MRNVSAAALEPEETEWMEWTQNRRKSNKSTVTH